MNLKTLLLVPAAALALVAAGCGDDENNNEPAAQSTPTQAQTSTGQKPVKPAPEEAAGGGEGAVKQVVLDFTFKGDCDTMTDKFLDTQAFIGETRAEKCDYFEKQFQKPQYKESDLKFRKVEINGDKASVVIGSDIANVQTEYKMLAEDGRWRIDEFDIL